MPFLAPILFRRVMASAGGPVERIISYPVSSLGKACFQANAFLSKGLIRNPVRHEVYGNSDGTGESPSSQIAGHMAISEALERWAFFATVHSPSAAKYGFDRDFSTTGMAAYPCLFPGPARNRARYEALERYAVVGWWMGCFAASHEHSPFPEVNLLRIHHNAGRGEVALLYRRDESGHAAYGRAAGPSLAIAARRALQELLRMEQVHTLYRARGGGVQVTDPLERRSLYYASPQGYAEFVERVDRRPFRPAPEWRIQFDGEIPGPWSQFVRVWRVVPDMPSYDYLDMRLNFFH